VCGARFGGGSLSLVRFLVTAVAFIPAACFIQRGNQF
jgi:hypothetical protein